MTSVRSLLQKAASGCAGTILTASALLAGSQAYSDEFPTETAALVAATVAYFERIEGEENRKRERTPVIRIPELAQKISAEAGSQTLTHNGPVSHLMGYRISWYPVERLLGSVDFMGTWNGNRNLVCGYLIWDLSEADAPVLEEVTANFLDLDELSQMSTLDAHAALLDANCAFGAIDENYAFFEVSD